MPFANGGYRPDVHFIRRITTAKGEVLYQHPKGGVPRVLRPEVVGMMNAMMTETLAAGTARKAAFAWPAAGKTGTSQNSRDAWFVGYTANLTTGVWFGNDDGKPMKNVTGGALPAIAWHEFMVAAHEGVPVARLPGGWGGGATPVPAVAVDDDGVAAPRPKNAVSGTPTLRDDDVGETASIRRPSVGVGQSGNSDASILDIILGKKQ